MMKKPAVSLAAVPGRRKRTLELGQEIEKRGFSGIYCPSFGDGLGLSLALAFETNQISLGTSITNIYTRPSTVRSGAAGVTPPSKRYASCLSSVAEQFPAIQIKAGRTRVRPCNASKGDFT